jgi:hypothetical protein
MSSVGAAYAALGTIAIIYVVGILFKVINILGIDNARIKVELECVKDELKCVKDELCRFKAEFKQVKDELERI